MRPNFPCRKKKECSTECPRNESDIDAASELLHIVEPYFTKQFVRNVIRKLPRIENDNRENVQDFLDRLNEKQNKWHPIITMHYRHSIKRLIETLPLHPLQRIVLEKKLSPIHEIVTYDYEASDRDSNLDIPYMT
jgi:hypothetical protein